DHALRDRLRAVTTAAVCLAMAWTVLGIAPAAAATPLKVVIIVGPTGDQTSGYRSTGNAIAVVAEAAGANVVKVYSPRATWARVRSAVSGANVVVYLGHGNGYPNPYSSGTEWTDRANGWGLNRTTSGGDSDDWSTKMVYCGEKALLGTLTASDGSAQWNYCGGKTNTDGIAPAANWVMIYNKACYAPGAGEGWDTKATQSVALQHVRNYSYPPLKAGAGAYFATDMYQGGQQLVDLVLRHRYWTFGAIAEAANGYDEAAQVRFAHPDLSGRQIWIQRTGGGMGTDYWYAYAGRPSLTPSGAEGVYVPPPSPEVAATSPVSGAIEVNPLGSIRARFDRPVRGVSSSSFIVSDTYGLTVPGTVSYSTAERRATFVPSRSLEAGLSYRATLTPAIKNSLGARLDRYSWSFTVSGPVVSSTTIYPEPQELVLAAGTNTRYMFTMLGTMRAERHATLAADTLVSTTVRRSLPNQSGEWFYVSSGSWRGYWLRESAAVYLSGEGAPVGTEPGVFDPAAAVRIRPGTHTGYTFSSTGVMIAAKTATVAWRVNSATELATIAGQAGTWFHMTTGYWNGYWLRASDVVYLDAGG
ncbi:MAG TPA: Ig-like domain-containing protein, partial [Candidatus Limnocylindrales bacterium]|nr:Ig-like domain-containing protein [Candidatus Limnocylindrales bacterium]